MGIIGLWDVIGKGEVTTIAEYATKHFHAHGRPLRIAVDEAGWRFSNLTPQQVAVIREKEPSANPIEKTIFWRLMELMKLNIQLIFVFDGPRRPWKRGRRGGGKIDYDQIRLLCQLLDHLKIPHHRAPAEAEAECAKMQRLGVVDAVWSDDSDTLMFGATIKLEVHKDDNGKRVNGTVRVHRSKTILQKHDLDEESLVCFAILSGGDYDTEGLRGCGPQLARQVARKANGLAHELCRATKQNLPAWRTMLEESLVKHGRATIVPSTFPDMKALGHYRNPTVSTPEQLQNLNGLRQGWDRQVDQAKLRRLLRERFNIWTQGYIKHLAPIFMIKELAGCKTESARDSNARFNVQLKPVRKKKVAEDSVPDNSAPTLTKITFDPVKAIEIDIIDQPEEEDWSKWSKNGVPYDQYARIEAEVLTCFLRKGLPEGSLTTPEPPKRSRKKTAGSQGQAAASPHHDRVVTGGDAPEDSQSQPLTSHMPQRKRSRPADDTGPPADDAVSKRRKQILADVTDDKIPSRPTFMVPRGFSPPNISPSKRRTDVVDLSFSDSDCDQERSPASMLTVQSSALDLPSITPTTPGTQGDRPARMVPGESMSPAELRALRAARLSLMPLNTPSAADSINRPVSRTRTSAMAVRPEIIDLT